MALLIKAPRRPRSKPRSRTWAHVLLCAALSCTWLTTARAEMSSEEVEARVKYVEEWRARYQRAQRVFLEQRDAEALVEFEQLAETAPTLEDRRVADEFAKLTRMRLQLELTKRIEPHIRTSDELSVLYTTAFVYGFGTSAWLALETKPKTFAAAVLPFIALTTASVGGVAVADSYRPFRLGVPQAIAGGMLLGFGESGWLVGYQNAVASRKDDDSHWDSDVVARVLWAGTTLGGVAGGVVGALREPTPGRVSFTASSALWGGLVTSFAAGAIQPERELRTETAFGVGALGYNAGLISGLLLGPSISPSVARVRFTDLGGLGGALLGVSSYLLIAGADSKPRGGLASASIGSVAGLAVGWWATSGMDPDVRPAPTTTIFSNLQPLVTPVNQGVIAGVSGTL